MASDWIYLSVNISNIVPRSSNDDRRFLVGFNPNGQATPIQTMRKILVNCVCKLYIHIAAFYSPHGCFTTMHASYFG